MYNGTNNDLYINLQAPIYSYGKKPELNTYVTQVVGRPFDFRRAMTKVQNV